MALSADTMWEVRADGNDDNGGGYVSGGTDYSQQAAAQLTLTDLACVIASTTLTSATGGFTAAMIGNLIQIKSGTNFTTGWYHITAYTDTNTVTIDRTACDGVGDASAGTGSVGGALDTPGQLGKALNDHGVDGMRAWVKSGTYTLSNSSANTSGGPISLPSAVRLTVEGYQTTRGDLGTRPEVNAGTETSITLIALNGERYNGYQIARNLQANGNSQTGIVGFGGGSGTYSRDIVEQCKAVDCDGFGFQSSTMIAIGCVAESGGVGFETYGAIGSVAHDNSSHGFKSYGGMFSRCIADGNGGSGFHESTAYHTVWDRCDSYDNTSDGFTWVTRDQACANECIAVNNGGYGYAGAGLYYDGRLLRCTGYNNTSGNDNGNLLNLDWVSISGDPFVNAASDDFRLNNTAGAGAVLRAAGLGVASQTDNQDIGAVQHTDPVGGGGVDLGAYSPGAWR